MRTTRTLARVLALLLLCLSAHRLLGTESGTVTVLLVGMLPVTLLAAYPALLLGALTRDRVLVALSAVLVAVHLALCLPRLDAPPVSEQARTASRLRVATANLYVQNPDPERAGRELRELDLDVLVVPELTPAGLAGLRASGLTQDLPHVLQIPGSGPETTGLLSRLPTADVRLPVFGGRGQPQAVVTVGGQGVRVLAFHAQPAISLFEQPWRNGLEQLARQVRAEPLPTVVAGDLNASRDNGPFRRLESTGLRDAHDERGRGLTRTWPAALPLTHYDHVLVRDGAGARIEVVDVREVRLTGSDHLAVVSTLAVVRR